MAKPIWDSNVASYDSLEEWAGQFYQCLAGGSSVFRRADGTLTYADPISGPRRVFGLDEFRAMAGNCVDMREGRGRANFPHMLNRDEAVSLFGSNQKGLLPEIEFVLHEPGVLTLQGRPKLIATPGYDPVSKSFLWVRPGGDLIRPRAGTSFLVECFSGVPFLNDKYRNNVIAWLVAGMCLDDINSPMLTVTGNDRGVGKSSMVQACGYILTGDMQNAIAPRGAEFEKQLGAKFAAEQRFVMLDNISTGGKSFSQAKLASLLTEGRSKQVRRLGHSRQITMSGVLFALTANAAKLDQDLATRSLPVVLYRETPGPMKPYCLSFAKEHRAEIFGELLTLALERDDTLLIGDEYDTCRFVDWINYVVPIVKPKFGQLAVTDAQDLDDRFQDLYGWGSDHLAEVFTAPEIYAIVMSNPDTFQGLWESAIIAKGEVARKMKISKYISTLVSREHFISPELTIVLRQVKKRTGHGATQYRFEAVT